MSLTGRDDAEKADSVMKPGRARPRWWLLALAASVMITGCTSGGVDDVLKGYVQEVLARKGGKLDPIPPLPPYVPPPFTPPGVDPFESFFKVESNIGKLPPCEGEGCVAPDSERNKEELESFALDSLRMMGTLEQNQDVWGIVRSPDGSIHRVQAGNYLGQNHGKIIDISEEKIELHEIVLNAQGNWEERSAKVALTVIE